MKNRLSSFLLAALLAVTLCVPARAAAHYDLIYDETELLDSDTLSYLGSTLLPEIPGSYGIDVRVDVLTSIGENPDVRSAAENLYENYEYGYEDTRNGVSLTLLVHEDDSGLALDQWCIYTAGDSYELVDYAPSMLETAVEYFLTAEAWSQDLEGDNEAFQSAVVALYDGLDELVQSGGVAETIYDPHLQPGPDDSTSGVLPFVLDTATLLDPEELTTLNDRAAELSREYQIGVYIATVDNYNIYSSDSVADAAETIFNQFSLGVGQNRSGILLLLSMDDRDYDLAAHGDGNYAFTDYGKGYLSDSFLDNFGDDDWYGGFEDYLETCGEMLQAAQEGSPVDVPAASSGQVRTYGIIACVLISFLAAFLVTGSMKRKMRSVAIQSEAQAYVTDGGLKLTVNRDLYTHTTQSRVYVEPDHDDDNDGGTSVNSDGFSHDSGKF